MVFLRQIPNLLQNSCGLQETFLTLFSSELDLNETLYQVYYSSNGAAVFPTTVTDRSGLRVVQYIGLPPNDPEYLFNSLATVPTVVSSDAIFKRISGVTLARAPQPYVHCHCWFNKAAKITYGSNQSIDFGPNKSFLKDVLSYDMLMPNYTNTADNESMTTLHIPASNSEYDFGYSFIWSRPPAAISNTSLLVVSGLQVPEDSTWITTSCVIEAYWATVTTKTATSSNYAVDNEVPLSLGKYSNWPSGDLPKFLSKLNDKALISLSPEWGKRVTEIVLGLTDIDAAWYFGTTWPNALYALALSYTATSDIPVPGAVVHFNSTYTQPQNATNMTSEQYTALLNYIDTNKLLQKFDYIVLYANGTEWTNPRTLAQLEQKISKVGYGYDTSTVTVKLSLAAMMFYLAATIIYLICTIATGNVATSWDSVAELVTLALNSQKPKNLKNVSVGIDTLETFRSPVNIRSNHDNSLEIVFDAAHQSGSFTHVQPNGKY